MLEQEINRYLNALSSGQGWHQPIEDWDWLGLPRVATTTMRIINKYILDASLEECLTSPSKYIRECKKYFTAQGTHDNETLDSSSPKCCLPTS